MANWVSHFGEKIIDNTGNEYNTATELDGKYVLIYYSASWCPPCRQFTPMLASVYAKLKNKANTEPFEVIFNSRDKAAVEFQNYFSEMPWKAVPFSSPIRKELDARYKVSGIPCLLVFDKNGELINREGRSAAMRDSNGENFPWYPKKPLQVIGDSLRTKSNAEVNVQSIQGNHFGVLFGGKWTGQKFTSFVNHLISIYPKVNTEERPFKLIYASLDKTEKDHRDVMGQLPDGTLTFEHRDPIVEELAETLGVRQLPSFAVVDNEGLVVNNNAYLNCFSDKTGEFFPWGPRAVAPLELASNEDINTTITVLAFANEGSDQLEQFKQFGTEYHAAFKRGEKNEVKFFYTDGNDDTSKRMRPVFKVPPNPSLLYLNLPKYFVSNDFASLDPVLTAITSQSFDQFSSL